MVDQLLTDPGGVLGADTAAVEQALDAVRTETGGALHVVLVSGFDGAASADWVEQVATRSDLGSAYLLLAIDVQGHAYDWWLGDTAPWGVTEVDQLLTAAAEPGVVDGDWVSAITRVAEGLRTGGVPPEAGSGGGAGESAASSTAATTGVVGLVVLVLLAGYQLARRFGTRQRQTPDEAERAAARG